MRADAFHKENNWEHTCKGFNEKERGGTVSTWGLHNGKGKWVWRLHLHGLVGMLLSFQSNPIDYNFHIIIF